MSVRRHGSHVGEELRVHLRHTAFVVVGKLVHAVRAARLPVVVEAYVRVAEVGERRRHAIDEALARDDRVHLGLQQRLVDIGAVLFMLTDGTCEKCWIQIFGQAIDTRVDLHSHKKS